MNTQEIVAKLWSMCHVLRDDGITYQAYVTELTYLLFLKMMKETGQESQLPSGYRWDDLHSREGVEQLNFYRELLVHLGTQPTGRVQAIFNNANSSLKKPKNLLKLVTDIDALDWYSARTEGLGDLYEGLLEKNASEKKSGAGQYFTPRPLIECMVNCIKPQPGEIIQDPAAGTGGFLTHADRYIKANTDDLFDLDEQQQHFQKHDAYHAVELVDDTQRLFLMNVMLHGMDGNYVSGDTMGSAGQQLPDADLILSNPPFGTKKGGGITRDDFTYPTSNKQLCFLQHIYRGLKPGGRAAVVLPDNVLFEEGVGTRIRVDLMDKCNLHTILRLPTGIFYAQGVKTNVLFFTRGQTDTGNTKKTWIYDLRTNVPVFGKRTPLTLGHFTEFEKCYGKKADGSSKRTEKTGGKKICPAINKDDTIDEGENSRFRLFTRDFVRERGDNLDISWLKDDSGGGSGDELAEPAEIAAMIRERLSGALAEMDALTELLEPTK
ncbi:Type I restriction enzyme EcoKI M protein [Roseimaritima multifibrata]|uniref:site-specific DNA-methyltransferase (adenine-specific) n=1 Tax=Roseimaritima multifibrata TaxID=1930274 RepID=A0A517MAB7_9BACT|nr:N-6 DNA methylase [Roseimaritima multifibrata]QDS91825.1 Type I restriction enzyme EcoKI M protein [Roseimaritima multifibrata]